MDDYHFDKHEEDLLRVLKYNRDLSDQVSKRNSQLLEGLNSAIAESLELLSVSESDVPKVSHQEKQKKFDVLKYDELVKKSKSVIHANIDFNDLLTEEEQTDALNELERKRQEFGEKVGLNPAEMVLVTLGVSLNVIRQVLNTFPERQKHDKAANDTKGHTKETSDRNEGWYYASKEQIIANPVPFDAIFGSKDMGANIGGGFEHRARTLGHDPVLGWIFGTMNILTSTVTKFNLDSYHVKTRLTNAGQIRDKITNHARFDKILSYSFDAVFHEGNEGKPRFVYALAKEGIHLKSDENSIVGLPLPGSMELLGEKNTKWLVDHGIDWSNFSVVAKQAGLSQLIDAILSILHGLISKKPFDEFYKFRTKKILLYSTLISQSINLTSVAITKDLKKMDIGGLLYAVSARLQDAFVMEQIYDRFMDEYLDSGILAEIKIADHLMED